MAQIANANSRKYDGCFVSPAHHEAGYDGSYLFECLMETSYDDSDYILSGYGPGCDTDVYVCLLAGATDPLSSTDHYVHYRYAKSAAGGNTINLTVELRQGYVSESSLGTLIATCGTHNNISETITQQDYTLSAGEADAITNYNDLYLRFVVTRS